MKIKLLDPKCKPYKKYKHDAGWDLKARSDEQKVIALPPLIPTQIKTGVCVEIPTGYVGDIRPRSGLAKVGIVAQYGTIDSTYRGEIKVTLINFNPIEFFIQKYERIAQLVIVPCLLEELEEVEELSESERGNKGFGSTGRF